MNPWQWCSYYDFEEDENPRWVKNLREREREIGRTQGHQCKDLRREPTLESEGTYIWPKDRNNGKWPRDLYLIVSFAKESLC